MQWLGYDVLVNCEVFTKDKLNGIEQGRKEPNPPPNLDITRKNLKNPTVSSQQIEQQIEGLPKYCKSIGRLCEPISRMIGGYCVQKHLLELKRTEQE